MRRPGQRVAGVFPQNPSIGYHTGNARDILEYFKDFEFWAPYMRRLHRNEASAIAHDEISVIKRPFRPEWSVGGELTVASGLWIYPKAARSYEWRGRIMWRVEFTVRDFRPRIPRRVPPMFAPPDTDEDGYPIDPTWQAIEDARISGSFTSSAALGVPDIAEGPDIVIVEQFAQDNRERFEDLRKAERQARRAKKLSSDVKAIHKRAERSRVDLTPELDQIEAAVENAKAALDPEVSQVSAESR